MKKQVHPAVTAVLLILTVGIIGWFFAKQMGNVGSLPPGAVGNPGPFSPGGAAVGKGGGPGGATGAAPKSVSAPGAPSKPGR